MVSPFDHDGVPPPIAIPTPTESKKMSKLVKREIMFIKKEDEYNVFPGFPVAADAIRVSNASWSLDPRMNERSGLRGSLGMEAQVYGGSLMNMEFEMEIKSSGVDGQDAEIHLPLLASGMQSYRHSFGEDKYRNDSTATTSVTLFYFADGLLYYTTGCRGNPVLQADSGTLAMITFSFTGHTFSEGLSGAPATSSSITLSSVASDIDGFYLGRMIAIKDGDAVSDKREITGYNGTTKVATISSLLPWGEDDPLVLGTRYSLSNGPYDMPMPTPAFNKIVPSAVLCGHFVANDYHHKIASISLDWGNEVSAPDDLSSCDGYGDVTITSRNPTGSFAPEATALTDSDLIREFKKGTVLEVSTGIIGVHPNRWQLKIFAASYQSVGQGDREGIRTNEMGFGAAESDQEGPNAHSDGTADNEFILYLYNNLAAQD